VIVLVGVLMIIYVTFGGMKGTTWVQIVKAVLLMLGTVLITILVLVKFGFNLSDLLGTAAEKSGKGEAFLRLGSSTVRIWSASSTSCRLAWPWSSAPLACRTS
jgi:cation/acetate symporter